MEGNTTFMDPPEAGGTQAAASAGRVTERKTIPFTFDKSYWSAGPRDEPNYCSQQTLFLDLGVELLDHAFNGFNACILACECACVRGCGVVGLMSCRRADGLGQVV
jgi:kinesin family protein 1